MIHIFAVLVSLWSSFAEIKYIKDVGHYLETSPDVQCALHESNYAPETKYGPQVGTSIFDEAKNKGPSVCLKKCLERFISSSKNPDMPERAQYSAACRYKDNFIGIYGEYPIFIYSSKEVLVLNNNPKVLAPMKKAIESLKSKEFGPLLVVDI